MFNLHDTLPFSAKLYDKAPEAGGVLVNATTVSLTITLPDQTTVTVSPTNPPSSTGTYSYNYPTSGGTTMAGRYVGVWLFTMATGQPEAYPEIFDVAPADPGFIVSIAQAKAQTNITTSTSDDELGIYIASATRVVEYFVGPVVIRSYSQRVSDRNPSLTHLPKMGPGLTPVLTLTTLTPLYTSGTTWSAASVVVDPSTGALRQSTGAGLYGGPWTAVYVAGQQAVDSNWQLAALIVIEHLWKTQRGASGLPLASDDETFIPGVGFAIPNRAADLLKLDSMPGIA